VVFIVFPNPRFFLFNLFFLFLAGDLSFFFLMKQSQPLVLKLVLSGKQWKKCEKMISFINKTNNFFFIELFNKF